MFAKAFLEGVLIIFSETSRIIFTAFFYFGERGCPFSWAVFWWNRVVSGVAMSGDFSHIEKKKRTVSLSRRLGLMK